MKTCNKHNITRALTNGRGAQCASCVILRHAALSCSAEGRQQLNTPGMW
jgi:hypothetical protein